MANDKERDPGSFSAEIEKYLEILAKDPNSRVFAPLAEAYRKAGFLDDAAETALEGLKAHPNYLGGRVALGRAYFEKKQYAEAAAEMQKVAKAAPDNIIAHKVLGQIAYSQSDLPAAEKAFKMVLLLDPRDQEAQQFIANLAGAAPPPAPPPPLLQAPAAPPSRPPLPVPPQATEVAKPQPVRQPPPQATVIPEPASGVQPSPARLPFDDIQALDDLELQADDIFGAPEAQPATPLPFAIESLEEFGAAQPLDPAEPEPWLPVQPPASAGAMELEVFSRLAWGGEKQTAPAETPVLPTATAPPPDAGAHAEASPFEVFGRPKRGGPPQSTRGEQVAFGEIDLESAVSGQVQFEPEPASESPFENFSRDPGPRTAPAAAKADRGADAGPRELDIETTAYPLADTFTPAGGEERPMSLEEELPRIDLTQELDFGPLDEPAPLSAAAELEPQIELEPEGSAEPQQETEPEPIAPPAPDLEIGLHEEIPSIDLAGEMRIDSFGEEYEDVEREPEPEPAGAAAERGVFDTETLASIYINQGFYGRAAEIYQRLVAQRPDDVGLRARLEEVLARERAEAGAGEPFAAVTVPVGEAPSFSPAAAAVSQSTPAAPPTAPAGPEKVISQLQVLLETFKGGRPR